MTSSIALEKRKLNTRSITSIHVLCFAPNVDGTSKRDVRSRGPEPSLDPLLLLIPSLVRFTLSMGWSLFKAKFFQATRERYWWLELTKDVEDVLCSFWQCARFFMRRSVTCLHPIDTQYSFELVTMDTWRVTLLQDARKISHGGGILHQMGLGSAVLAKKCATIDTFIQEEVIERLGTLSAC